MCPCNEGSDCRFLRAYENKGKVDQAADKTDPLMDTLSSMNRVQQVELICGKYFWVGKFMKFINLPSQLKKMYVYEEDD